MATPKLKPDQIAQVSGLVAGYISTQREKYALRAAPVSVQQREPLEPFFSREVLDNVRVLVLRGERVANPELYPVLRSLGFKNLQGSPRQEIARVIEGREERDSETAVGHGVKNAVTGCCQEQIGEQCESPDSGCSTPEDGKGDYARQESGENQRMRETTMSPEVAVVDAETESN